MNLYALLGEKIMPEVVESFYDSFEQTERMLIMRNVLGWFRLGNVIDEPNGKAHWNNAGAFS